ncbi:MAG TPA: toll/interleukin-1 receptor domain-containing protein [Anaerolineales bacterium]|nr:toll/interleukin-1 receptor domain-containing protein [Anaerolineales bacterium]
MQRLFISYSRKDIDFVRRLAGDLEKAGYDVWWDISDLRGGDDWVREIPTAIEASDFFIVVLTPNAAVSEWVSKEYTQALTLRKKIIPIMLRRTSVPFALNTINYVDFTTDEYGVSLRQLLDALEYGGDPPVAPAPLFPVLVRKYFVPVIVGIGFVLAVISTYLLMPSVISTATPSPTEAPATTPPLPTPTSTETLTPTLSPTASPSPSATLTPTPTRTATLSPSVTPSPTNRPFARLGLCVVSDFANSINVRSGPGTIYAPLGGPLPVDTCLFFSARNEESTWLQIAPNQQDASLQQYEAGWIYRELLGLGTLTPIDLPAVTLTPTPPPSDTPTRTPTVTATETETPTETPTP